METFVKYPKLITQIPTLEEEIPIRTLNKIILIGIVSLKNERQQWVHVHLLLAINILNPYLITKRISRIR
jgi:hypothetical protein